MFDSNFEVPLTDHHLSLPSDTLFLEWFAPSVSVKHYFRKQNWSVSLEHSVLEHSWIARNVRKPLFITRRMELNVLEQDKCLIEAHAEILQDLLRCVPLNPLMWTVPFIVSFSFLLSSAFMSEQKNRSPISYFWKSSLLQQQELGNQSCCPLHHTMNRCRGRKLQLKSLLSFLETFLERSLLHNSPGLLYELTMHCFPLKWSLVQCNTSQHLEYVHFPSCSLWYCWLLVDILSLSNAS